MNRQVTIVVQPTIDPNLIKDLQSQELYYEVNDRLLDNQSEPNTDYFYIVDDFSGEYFARLRNNKKFIFGTTALKQLLDSQDNVFLPKHPIHNQSMSKVCVAMSRASKELTKKHIDLVHFMGGSCRKNIDAQVNHLVAYGPGGDKYRTASNLDIAIMNPEWIDYSWEQRFDPTYSAIDPNIIEKFRLKPFDYLFIAFVGFPDGDLSKMKELTSSNGGTVVLMEDPKCTHIVVYAISGESDPDLELNPANENVKIVYEESAYVLYYQWFWTSIQIRLKAEETTPDHAYPWGMSRRSTFNASMMNATRMSVMSPSLDYTRIEDSPVKPHTVVCSVDSPYKPKTKKQLIVEELLETENNYIQILEALVNEIQREMENSKLLDEGQVKIIFGKLPEILKVHLQFSNSIKAYYSNWNESTALSTLAAIFTEYSPKMLEKYSPYVNSMESSKEVINSCKKDERFYALLKKCESKPECKRASLTDLLSRPFQRLFHVRNLLQRLLDDTSNDCLDRNKLALAIAELDKTLAQINEKKRKTENHLAQFADFARIKDLPLELISANNRINGQINARKLRLIDGKLVPCTNMSLVLFLLNDVLEVCKRRSVKRTSSFTRASLHRSPGVQRSGSYSGSRDDIRKPFRHIGKIEYSSIKMIETFNKSEGYGNLFVLILRPETSNADKDDIGFRYLPLWMEADEEKGQSRERFITEFGQKMEDNGFPARRVFTDKNSAPSIDLRYSDKFFLTACNYKSMSFRFGKRFKMDSVMHAFSPL